MRIKIVRQYAYTWIVSMCAFDVSHFEHVQRDCSLLYFALLSIHVTRQNSGDAQQSNNGERAPAPAIPNDMRPRIGACMKLIDAYMDPCAVHTSPLTLTGYSAFERKLIYGSLEYKYGRRVYTQLMTHDQSLLVYYCVDEAEYEALRRRTFDEKMVCARIMLFCIRVYLG
jgi:hypothetical protein